MSVERLDLSAIEVSYTTTPLPSDKRPDGKRLFLGEEHAAVALDIFPDHPPLVRVRPRGNEELLTLANVTCVLSDEQGIRITNTQSDCLVSKEGQIIFTRTPPPLPPKPLVEGRSVMRYDKDGVPYQQSTFDIAGTPEGVRVHVRGMVQGTPKQEGKGKERHWFFSWKK